MKIVIKVYLDGKRCRPKALRIVIYVLKRIMPYEQMWKKRCSASKLRIKAMKTAVASPGVASVAFAGEEKDQLVVAGEGIDAVNLTKLIRRNVGFAQILSLGSDDKKK